MVADLFHRFAEEKVRPHAEHVHRTNGDIPESIIEGLAELGGFGLSIPEKFGGFATGGESEYVGMVVATEELSWGSLGIGGSLITRPEILTRALLNGGTTEQQERWLPRLASGETLCAIAVTEPDFGSTSPASPRAPPRPRAAGCSVARRPGARSPRERRCWCCSRVPTLIDPWRIGDSPLPRREAPRRQSRVLVPPRRRGRRTKRRQRPTRRDARSTRSAIAVCTPTSSASTTGSYPTST
jgi:hypothetical protein